MGFQVDIKTVVSRLGQIDFLQPLFEAVTNSLEANADTIDISIDIDDSQLLLPLPNSENERQFYKISGFTVTDNGDGFTPENIQSFKTLYSDAKRDWGCKGVGRLTWLKVFKKVKIESWLKTSNVVIDFDENFSEANVKETEEPNTDKTSTRITFSNVLPSFLPTKKNQKDKREDGNIEEVCKKIKQYLLVKLALLKEQKRDFYISVTIGKEHRRITTVDIPDLTNKQFSITGYQERRYNFTLLYSIISGDGLNQKEAYYCANGRTVSKIPNDAHFLQDISTQDSIIMLLASEYLDEKVNDERNDFEIKPKDETLTEPISFSNISDKLQNEIGKILSEHYHLEVKELNKKAVEEAIEEQPHLATYIREDKTFIKTKSRLINNAREAFGEQKQKTSRMFSKMLEQKNVDPKTFNKNVAQVQQIASQELGEYILYRQQIIDALKKALEDKEKKEKYIHNLIMPMKSASDNHTDSIVEKGYATNLWLLDDKYMTYFYAASDKTVKQITKVITQNYAKYKSAARPDIAVFFNRSSNSKDAIICELKGAHASADEKNKSITELPNNIGIIRENIKDINRIWGYIITEIDDELRNTLKRQDFKPLFTNNENGTLYFKYFENNDAYITVLDLKTLIADANARNKLFLDILSR